MWYKNIYEARTRDGVRFCVDKLRSGRKYTRYFVRFTDGQRIQYEDFDDVLNLEDIQKRTAIARAKKANTLTRFRAVMWALDRKWNLYV